MRISLLLSAILAVVAVEAKNGDGSTTSSKQKVDEIMSAVNEHCTGLRRKRQVGPSSEDKVRGLVLNVIKDCLDDENDPPNPPALDDCQEIFESGVRTPGIYTIQPKACLLPPFPIWCDFFDGHGWSVLSRRADGSQNFTQNWNAYKMGFGTISNEYWLGNERIHCLTKVKGNKRLNVYVEDDAQDDSRIGTWQDFYVDDESTNYTLTVTATGYVGTLPTGRFDGYSDGMQFSTPERDNDNTNSHFCGATHFAGWWYNACQYFHHTGRYGDVSSPGTRGLRFYDYSDVLTASVIRVTRD